MKNTDLKLEDIGRDDFYDFSFRAAPNAMPGSRENFPACRC
jgi:hypothetical protein